MRVETCVVKQRIEVEESYLKLSHVYFVVDAYCFLFCTPHPTTSLFVSLLLTHIILDQLSSIQVKSHHLNLHLNRSHYTLVPHLDLEHRILLSAPIF